MKLCPCSLSLAGRSLTDPTQQTRRPGAGDARLVRPADHLSPPAKRSLGKEQSVTQLTSRRRRCTTRFNCPVLGRAVRISETYAELSVGLRRLIDFECDSWGQCGVLEWRGEDGAFHYAKCP